MRGRKQSPEEKLVRLRERFGPAYVWPIPGDYVRKGCVRFDLSACRSPPAFTPVAAPLDYILNAKPNWKPSLSSPPFKKPIWATESWAGRRFASLRDRFPYLVARAQVKWERDKQVLNAVEAGLVFRVIARSLGVSPQRVSQIVLRLRRKKPSKQSPIEQYFNGKLDLQKLVSMWR